MKRFRRHWNNLSIARKLYSIVGVMAFLIVGELLTLQFAMGTLSAVRAFVGGESSWSKGQKNALISLQQFGHSGDEAEYRLFQEYLRVPEGDHVARLELLKAKPDLEVVTKGFIQGQIHPDDIPPMVRLLRRFHSVPYLARAIAAWTRGDELMQELKASGERYHAAMTAKPPLREDGARILAQITALDQSLTEVELEFSNALGEGSRWMERVVLSLLLIAVMTVETIGITLTLFTSRSLSRRLNELSQAAHRIGQGDFKAKIQVQSDDELGKAGVSVNHMGQLLDESYRALEAKVQERTRELQQLAIKNEELYKEARSAVAARDEFLSIASHELKNPLTAMHMNLQLLARLGESSGDERLQKLTGMSFQQAERLHRLIEQLFDLTRLRTGRLEIRREICDLSALVREALEEARAEASQKHEIRLEVLEGVKGSCDSTRIRQAFANLISNAIKYGAGKPILIRLACAESGKAVFQVQDQGKGISEEDQKRIFERFERVSEDPGIKGFGLGLFITREIVEAHGGSISVESELGKGSAFRIEL